MFMEVYFVLYILLIGASGGISLLKHGKPRPIGIEYNFWLWVVGTLIVAPILYMAALKIYGG